MYLLFVYLFIYGWNGRGGGNDTVAPSQRRNGSSGTFYQTQKNTKYYISRKQWMRQKHDSLNVLGENISRESNHYEELYNDRELRARPRNSIYSRRAEIFRENKCGFDGRRTIQIHHTFECRQTHHRRAIGASKMH